MREHDQNSFVEQGLARWYRGRLIPVIKGGDERDPLFPPLPVLADGAFDADALAAMTDEQIAELLSQSLAAKDRVVAQDAEFLGSLSAAEILAQMQAGVSGILRLKAEQAARVEAQENLAGELAALSAQVEEPEPAPAADPAEEPEGDPADPAEEPATPAEPAADPARAEPEAVLAAAPPEQRPLRRMPAQGRHAAPPAPVPIDQGMVLRASAGLGGFTAGDVLDAKDGESALNVALVDAIRRNVATPKGFRDTVVVAHGDIEDSVPRYRRLYADDIDGNKLKIETLVAAAKAHGVGYDGVSLTASGAPDLAEAEALTASGGICAPLTPYYQLAYISTMQRPVRDSLVGFVADRGGIRYAPPPYLGQINEGVGIISAEQDAAGGSTGTKSCQPLICPEFVDAAVDSIFHCFEGGNLGARAFPEQAAQFSSLILTQHARVAETNLLNKIKAGSTAVTGQSSVLGATASLLNDILTAAAAYRSNNRMADDAPLQVILPSWTGDLLLIDLIQSQFQRFAYNQAGIEALLGTFNIRVTFTLDGPSDGTGQVLGRQAAGPMLSLPTEVQWPLFHPGAWLFVDSGVLELGIVRDSSLNAINAYQVFGESWETAAGIGVQSLWVTSTVCPSGEVALAASNAAACGRTS